MKRIRFSRATMQLHAERCWLEITSDDPAPDSRIHPQPGSTCRGLPRVSRPVPTTDPDIDLEETEA